LILQKPSRAGSSADFIARTLEEMQGRDEEIDWWERGNPQRRRR